MAEPANDIVELETPGGADSRAAESASGHAEWIEEDETAFGLEEPTLAERFPTIAIILLALGWTGFVGWTAYSSIAAEAPTLTQIANWIAIASVPLALLGVIWLLTQRTSRREAARFGRTSEAMRAEARRLDNSIAIVASQLAEIREGVSAETDRLLALGDEAAGRLRAVSDMMREASASIEQKSGVLDRATKSAREDVDVLMADLPRAEQQARAVSTGLREAGINAHEQAAALDTQLLTLKSRGEQARDVASGAAQSLAANLARIEGVAEVAAAKLNSTGNEINATVDAVLDRSSAAVDDTRKVVDEIGVALTAMIENARTNFSQEGEEAAAALDARISATDAALEAFDERLTEQRAATTATLGDLDTGLGDIESRLVNLSEDGAAHARALGEEIAALSADMSALGESIGGNDEATERLIARAAEVKAALDLSAASLGEALPQAFAETEARAAELKTAVTNIEPDLEALQKMADDMRSFIGVSGESLEEQRVAIAAFIDQVGDRISTMRSDIDGIESALTHSAEQAESIADGAAPRLIETLMEVREIAAQAAEKARAAFGEVIPHSAAALSDATQQAMTEALGENVEERIARLTSASERAAETAQTAIANLDAKMEEIESRSTALENQLREVETETEEASLDGFARRVTLLIESLNSTAIDVSKILSNEVTDTAWAAYLKGDRGIFSRRAVRLLDTGEAREIVAQYENNSEFREQVNRYVHDFEAMLRRVLTARDGAPLAVTLLSSDNGKLYVALAQAIERLR
ncbi:hypothetical protein HFP57_04550 [Parasphingopyxis algicola]|uniref:hypothetical protein n=1 Tax=Parasphingopyxis algicola TaxID=2026624 RepID=UPI0015A35291|nr:hypothetical protein [Parasphingopyxis algicola]QLC24369.1 hypothetical protein HFP57_04550 [Parasphingopyxis algicola]